MKKILSLACLAILLTAMISCSKEEMITPQSVEISSKNFADGNWQQLSFYWSCKGSFTGLEATQSINTIPVEAGTNLVHLAYIRVPGQHGYSYYRIPAALATANENIQISSEFTPGLFIVRIWNAVDPTRPVDAEQFTDYRFRYLIMTQDAYRSLQVNWNDYRQVASRLGLSL